MEWLWEFLQRQGPWAFTLSGFIIVLCVSGIVWLSRRSLALSDARIKQLELANDERIVQFEKEIQRSLNNLRLELGEIRMELAECESNDLSSQGLVSGGRSLIEQFRALYIHTIGGRREASPELAQLDARKDEWIRTIHTDRTNRLLRLKEKTARIEQMMLEDR